MNALVPAYSHIVEAGSMKLTTFDKIPISFAVSKIWISYISEDFMSSVRQMYYFSTQSILPLTFFIFASNQKNIQPLTLDPPH